MLWFEVNDKKIVLCVHLIHQNEIQVKLNAFYNLYLSMFVS